VRQTVIPRVFFNERELRSGWRLLIFLTALVGLTAAGNLVIARLLPQASGVVLFFVREVMDLCLILFCSWMMGRLEGRTIGDYGLPYRKMFGVQFWQGMAFGFGAITVLLVAMRLAGVFHITGRALRGTDVLLWAGVYGLVFALVAVREEFRARGYVQFTLVSGIGFWPAAILTSAYFAVSHLSNQGENWIGITNAGIFGLVTCLILQRSGNLWMPIGLHLAFDWGETYFYGVADSGHVEPGHLLDSATAGPTWLAGGSVGPEGSILATVVVIALGIISAMWLRSNRYPSSIHRRRTGLLANRANVLSPSVGQIEDEAVS
jgi:membrane protease YdiL (CAAX protease family)